jgi:outer membrane protein TolC
MFYKTIRCVDYKHACAQLPSLFQRGLWLFIIASMPSLTYAQISFSAAIDLALKNSPRVKMAEDDAERATASLSELKDAFIPRVIGSSGLGASSGITLSVPTIFTISAQSLLFDYSQQGYIRAGRLGVQAAGLSLRGIREQVEEDAIVTYLSLDNAYQCQAALTSQYEYALRLVSIVQERFGAGYESELELKKARRTVLQIKLQKSQMEDRIATLTEHLRGLTGLTNESELIAPESIPRDGLSSDTLLAPAPMCPDSPNTLSAEADAKAKLERASGESRRTWMPQVAFEAQYGRISPFNNVSTYYNLNGNYNTLAVGVQFQFPFLDLGRKAKARESMAEASRAEHQVASLRSQQREDCVQLQHSYSQLATRAELMELDQEIAATQLKVALLQQDQGVVTSTSSPVTPKESQNARIQERQRYLDMIEAIEQLHEAKVHLLRQSGRLDEWVNSLAGHVKAGRSIPQPPDFPN